MRVFGKTGPQSISFMCIFRSQSTLGPRQQHMRNWDKKSQSTVQTAPHLVSAWIGTNRWTPLSYIMEERQHIHNKKYCVLLLKKVPAAKHILIMFKNPSTASTIILHISATRPSWKPTLPRFKTVLNVLYTECVDTQGLFFYGLCNIP